MANDEKKLHIAMFPWLAFSHMIPYLELAKLIASKGHRISFASTPRNFDRLPKLPPSLASLVNFVKLTLPHVDNLPENAEATIDMSRWTWSRSSRRLTMLSKSPWLASSKIHVQTGFSTTLFLTGYRL